MVYRVTILSALAILASILAACVAQPAPPHEPPRILPLTLLSPLRYVPYITQAHNDRIGVSIGYASECGRVDQFTPRWVYSWGVEWCAWMQTDQRYADAFYSQVGVVVWGDYVIGFNEIDAWDQANISPVEAAIRWRLVETRYPDKILICPTGASASFVFFDVMGAYLDLFNEEPMRCDALQLHWHAPFTGGYTLQTYVGAFRQRALAAGYDVPIWVTEIGTCVLATAEDSMREWLAWLDAQTYVAMYAWYTIKAKPEECWHDTDLIDDNGNLTALGEIYRDRDW